MNGYEEATRTVGKQIMASKPEQFPSPQCCVCQEIYDQARDLHHRIPTTYLPDLAPCDFLLFPNVSQTRLETVVAAKANASEGMKQLSGNDLEHFLD
ncbi:hypothetical protein AVEN_271464-1 [Araneus ventricosus]|uniref:Uncharacterized protein n=1 Tax=Araneus ventricosus TaxID=182803 RepID=A0A4Y2X7L9_ARAVE|nr:hypothetical protein AVEN_271464-1 [Araneus ventricosus]